MRTAIQESILQLLQERRSSYAHPLNSQTISEVLNITPSYVREQMSQLQREKQVAVRRGPKGGYYHMTIQKTLRVQWNDEVMEHVAGTFLPVYQQLMQIANQDEQIITELKINGVDVLPDSVEQLAHQDITDAVIRTQPMAEFANGLLSTASEYLPKLRQGLVKIASLFQEGREGDAHAMFVEAVDGLEWLDSCLGGLSAWMMPKGDSSLLALHGTYQGQIAELGAMMEQKSITDIADLLEYELAETVAAVQDRFAEMQSLLQAAGKGL